MLVVIAGEAVGQKLAVKIHQRDEQRRQIQRDEKGGKAEQTHEKGVPHRLYVVLRRLERLDEEIGRCQYDGRAVDDDGYPALEQLSRHLVGAFAVAHRRVETEVFTPRRDRDQLFDVAGVEDVRRPYRVDPAAEEVEHRPVGDALYPEQPDLGACPFARLVLFKFQLRRADYAAEQPHVVSGALGKAVVRTSDDVFGLRLVRRAAAVALDRRRPVFAAPDDDGGAGADRAAGAARLYALGLYQREPVGRRSGQQRQTDETADELFVHERFKVDYLTVSRTARHGVRGRGEQVFELFFHS